MIFYQNETCIGLVLASLPAILNVYYYFILEKKKSALFLLLTSAFLLRLLMISLDPYLHKWDERFHALVAKHMIEFPFKPMLFLTHVVPFDAYDWSYNHIWVHKQPLFLWQMAMSMKILGVSTFAMRLPSALMGTMMVWLVYDMSLKWIGNDRIAFSSAFLTAFAYFTLELTSGVMSLDHNDIAFVFYTTCACWSFVKYIHNGYKLNWALLIGLFAGLAILNKWLVGLLIFGGWGLYLLISSYRSSLKMYIHLGLSLGICFVIFGPWQLYIMKAFPLESAIAYQDNRKHITESMGHPGNAFYHFTFLPTAYHSVLIGFLIPGVIFLFGQRSADKKISISFLAMIIVVFSFFSYFVSAKMPAFVYTVSALLIILMSVGIYISSSIIFKWPGWSAMQQNAMLCLVTILMGFFSMKPWAIMKERSQSNTERNAKIYYTQIYKKLGDQIVSNNVIINCREYENIDIMFYHNALAYHFYPDKRTIDSLKHNGIKLAAFEYPNDRQQLPDYISKDKEILILSEYLK